MSSLENDIQPLNRPKSDKKSSFQKHSGRDAPTNDSLRSGWFDPNTNFHELDFPDDFAPFDLEDGIPKLSIADDDLSDGPNDDFNNSGGFKKTARSPATKLF